MDEKLRADLEELLSLMETPAWRTLMRHTEEGIEEMKHAVMTATSWDQVNYLRGRADQMVQLLNLEDYCLNLLEMEDDSAEDV